MNSSHKQQRAYGLRLVLLLVMSTSLGLRMRSGAAAAAAASDASATAASGAGDASEDVDEVQELKHLPFKYIMTDFSLRTVEFWRDHPSLKPLVDLGILDFAVFNAETDSALHLVNADIVLNASTLKNPLVVVSNYVFDSLTAVRASPVRLPVCAPTPGSTVGWCLTG